MKKCLLIVSINVLSLSLFASEIKDTINEYTYAYQFDQNYFLIHQVKIDTLLDRFQIYNPVFKNSISSTYLGNLGLANQNNIFLHRTDHEFIFLNPFHNYMYHPENFTFYHTRRPYTNITYTSGGSKTYLEQTISVIHTQNVNENINLGFKYNLNSSLGQYIYQKAKHNSFSIFSGYRKKKYSMHFNASLNKLNFAENGGIVSDSLLYNMDGRTSSVNVNLMNANPGDKSLANTLIKNKSLLLLNKYTFTKYVENNETDSLNPDTIKSTSFFTISHMLKIKNTSRNYYDNSNLGFYNLVTDTANTSDSTYYRTIVNSLRFELHETKRRKRPGIIVSFNHERDKYSFKNYFYENTTDSSISLSHGFLNQYLINPPITSPDYNTDTIGDYVLHKPVFNRYISNSSVSALLYKILSEKLKWSLYGNYYFQGYKQNDYNLTFVLYKPLNKYSNAQLKASVITSHPKYVYQQFSSDHFYWENTFQNKKISTLSIAYNNSKINFQTQITGTLLKNHIYLEESGGTYNLIIPKQIGDQIPLLTFIVKKDFQLWNIHSNSQLVYQKMPDNYEKYLPLPELIFYNSTYFDRLIKFHMTGGKLRVQLGFDIFYHSKYLAQDYNPALGLFYLQNENKEIGNYPFVDAFLNLRVKRVRFFIKYEHLNSGFSGDKYFTALHYPMNWRVIRMGLSWRFNN